MVNACDIANFNFTCKLPALFSLCCRFLEQKLSMATSFPRRRCLNSPNVFCYVCGEYTLQLNRKRISEFVKCAYLAYFKVMLGDQDRYGHPILYARNVLSIFDSGQKRIESHSALAFQWSGVNRKIILMTATSVQSTRRESTEKTGIR